MLLLCLFASLGCLAVVWERFPLTAICAVGNKWRGFFFFRQTSKQVVWLCVRVCVLERDCAYVCVCVCVLERDCAYVCVCP